MTRPVLAVGMSTFLFGKLAICATVHKICSKANADPTRLLLVFSYAGSGAPSSMYMGVTPYAASPFNGTSMPPYDGFAYHYNYNSRLPGGNPYRPLQLSATPTYSGGPMIGTGVLYGLPQLMEQFGLRLPIAQAAMKSNLKRKLLTDGTRENDWECPKCANVNFPTEQSEFGFHLKQVPKQICQKGAGRCDKCNNINYPFRTICNRKNCGAYKPLESHNSPTEEENDQ